jgi:dihydroxyacetone kinase
VGVANVTTTVTDGVSGAYNSAFNTVTGRKLLVDLVQHVVQQAHAQQQ